MPVSLMIRVGPGEKGKIDRLAPIAAAIILALLAASCVPETEVQDKIAVVVTVLPQAEFVENIGGEKVNITVMVPPGASPHMYEPTPSQMTAVARADMYIKVGSGIDFERVWMEKLIAVGKDMLVVNCAGGIELQASTGDEHGGLDPHIWMSPLNTVIMVQNIYNGLVQVDPEGRTYYGQNRDAYLAKLTQLDRDIRKGLSRVTNRTFMVYHPAFGYFGREYGLTMLAVEEEGKEPAPASLARLIEQAREYDVKVIFASPQFNPQSARVIADAIDGRVVFIDPLAREYMMNMRLLLGELVQGVE